MLRAAGMQALLVVCKWHIRVRHTVITWLSTAVDLGTQAAQLQLTELGHDHGCKGLSFARMPVDHTAMAVTTASHCSPRSRS